ncbi:hypothetical protein LEN26_016995 [Aphanomyces euteiches]|nr:hypothetical protein LEN26_016995 [Aphanomyces euteiches]
MAMSMSIGTVFVDGSASADEAPRILRQDQLMLPHMYAPLKGATACHECTKTFSTFRRKYNCQMCGEVVCRSCTVLYVAEVSKDVIDAKVCLSCVAIVEAEYHESVASERNSRHTSHSGSYRSPGSADKYSSKSHRASSSIDTSSTALVLAHTSSSVSNLVSKSTPYDYELDFSWAHPWPKPPLVDNDAQRVQVLHSYQIADKEPAFDGVCELASKVLHCPIAAVCFVDERYQLFKASLGLAQEKIPRSVSFCAHAIVSKEPVVVLDTTTDARFQHNPMVTGAGIKFYASAPVCAPSGHVLGTVCVMDQQPHISVDINLLEVLANVVVKKLEDSERLRVPRRSSTDSRSHGRSSSSSQAQGASSSDDEFNNRLSTSSNAPPGLDLFITASDLLPRTQWVSDSKRTTCKVCVQKFSMFLRKHHCRLCGEVICKNCAMSAVLDHTPGSTKVVRIAACLTCLSTRANKRRDDSSDEKSVSSAPTPASSTSSLNQVVLKTTYVPTPPQDMYDEIQTIPVLHRNQSYDVDTNMAIYNEKLVLDYPTPPPVRDFTQQEIQSMLVHLLSQSNDIQQQLSQSVSSSDRALSR